MIIKTRKEALLAFNEPLKYVSLQRKRYLFRLYYLIATLVILFGIAAIVSAATSDNRSDSFEYRHVRYRFAGGFLMVTVPMYGLYRLFTVKKSVTRHLKRQLTNKEPPIDLG